MRSSRSDSKPVRSRSAPVRWTLIAGRPCRTWHQPGRLILGLRELEVLLPRLRSRLAAGGGGDDAALARWAWEELRELAAAGRRRRADLEEEGDPDLEVNEALPS